jgi:hypothetical protein
MGGSTPAPQQQDNSATLAMIANMQAQQATAQKAAQRAQDQAIYNSQVQAANQGAATSAQQAQQQLGLAEQYQQAKDAAAMEAQKQASFGAGIASTGGGYDIGAAQKAQLSNLGAASGLLPQTSANVGGISPIKNPAATTAGSMTAAANKGVTGANQFQLPSASGVVIR